MSAFWKGFFLAVMVWTLSLFFAAQGHCQANVDIPKDEVAGFIKPYLGTWNFAVCAEKPYGVRIAVGLNAAKDTPTVNLVELQGHPNLRPAAFHILDFVFFPGNDKAKSFTWLNATNDRIILTLVPTGTALSGHVTVVTNGTVYDIFGQRSVLKDPVNRFASTITLDEYMASGVTALCYRRDPQPNEPGPNPGDGAPKGQNQI